MQELCNKKAVFPFREAFSDTLPASAAELALQTHLGSIIFIENSQSPTEYDFKCLQHQSSFQSWRFWPVHYLCMSTQLSNLAHAHTCTHTHTHIHTHMYWQRFFGTLCDLARCYIDDKLRQEGQAQNLFRSLEKDASWIWVEWFTYSGNGTRRLLCHSMYFSFLRSAHQW